jgi:quercetin dioxygenase-like cupin family protein
MRGRRGDASPSAAADNRSIDMPIIQGPNANASSDEFAAWGYVEFAKGRENITEDHFHDCDEWVFMVKGKCLMISEGKNYILEKGDVLVTRMGDTHELVKIFEDTAYFWCETALRGKKRKGHLRPGQDVPNDPDA